MGARPPSRAALRGGPTACARAGVLALLAMLAAPGAGAAEDEAPFPAAGVTPPERVDQEELVRDASRALRVYAGVEYVSQYVSRGLVFLDEPSLQPWVELDLRILEAPDAPVVRALAAFAGSWNNVSLSGRDDARARTGRAAALEDWYETDVYAGLRLRLGERVTTSLRYNWYTSPEDAFRDIHEIDWRIAYDDAPFWDRPGLPAGFALYPALRVARELHDAGGPDGWYFQPALTATWRPDGLPLPVTVQLPLVLGFGASGQYVGRDGDERHFGFFQTGLELAVGLDVLPEGGGSVDLSVGVDHVVLSDDALGFDGSGSETIGRVGLVYAF